jgi:hypothetical protein
MSEFTPTTKMIRGNLASFLSRHTPMKKEEVESQFDRWLEQHDAEVAKATEERTIKLLEAMDCGDESCIHDACCFSEDAIALIEGENKQEYPQALPLPPKTPENTQPNWTGF